MHEMRLISNTARPLASLLCFHARDAIDIFVADKSSANEPFYNAEFTLIETKGRYSGRFSESWTNVEDTYGAILAPTAGQTVWANRGQTRGRAAVQLCMNQRDKCIQANMLKLRWEHIEMLGGEQALSIESSSGPDDGKAAIMVVSADGGNSPRKDSSSGSSYSSSYAGCEVRPP